MPKLIDILALQGQKMRLALEAARLFVGHTDIGNTAEHAIRQFLTAFLPTKYAIGVGEVIAPEDQNPNVSQQKDVLIYDPIESVILDWEESGTRLFPVESIYAVIEVKTSIGSAKALERAIDQAIEIKRICQSNATRSKEKPPFTAVIAFESIMKGQTIFDTIYSRPVERRADFVLIVRPKKEPETSYYFAHWHYFTRMGGRFKFVTTEEVIQERLTDPIDPDKRLTFGKTPLALLWFYMFFIEEINTMHLEPPNLWNYVSQGGIAKIDPGYVCNE